MNSRNKNLEDQIGDWLRAGDPAAESPALSPQEAHKMRGRIAELAARPAGISGLLRFGLVLAAASLAALAWMRWTDRAERAGPSRSESAVTHLDRPATAREARSPSELPAPVEPAAPAPAAALEPAPPERKSPGPSSLGEGNATAPARGESRSLVSLAPPPGAERERFQIRFVTSDGTQIIWVSYSEAPMSRGGTS